MADFYFSEIDEMRALLERLYLKIGECYGRVSLAKLLQLSKEVDDGVYSTYCFISALTSQTFPFFYV